jgi:hypothetical protein
MRIESEKLEGERRCYPMMPDALSGKAVPTPSGAGENFNHTNGEVVPKPGWFWNNLLEKAVKYPLFPLNLRLLFQN